MGLRSFRLQDDVVKKLTQLADKAQRSGNWIANEALREYFSRREHDDKTWAETLEAFEEAARDKIGDGKEIFARMQTWFQEKKKQAGAYTASMIPAQPIRLQTLWSRGTEFLGCEFAIMGGAMSWVSEHNLVSALSNAGAFGVIACGSMSPALLKKEIIKTRRLTSRPFGVNLILMHPDINDLIDVCGAEQVSHIVLAGGIPKASVMERIKSFDAKVMCFAPSLPIARKLIKLGADALVIEGMEAGGHIGPVSTSVLAQEILPKIRDVPVFVAGGIGRGEAITSYVQMGAAGVQLGTRFVCASESIAHPHFKETFIKSTAREAIPSIQIYPDFPVIPVRAIENKAAQSFTRFQHEIVARYHNGEIDKKSAQLQIEHFWAGALRKAVIDGDVENGSLMAGQSVGMVTKIEPVASIIRELVAQAEAHLGRRLAA